MSKLIEITKLLQEVQGIGAPEIRSIPADQRQQLIANISDTVTSLGKLGRMVALAEFDGDEPSRLHALWASLSGATQTLTLEWVEKGCPRGRYEPFSLASPGIRGEIREQISEFRSMASTATEREIAYFVALAKAPS